MRLTATRVLNSLEELAGELNHPGGVYILSSTNR